MHFNVFAILALAASAYGVTLKARQAIPCAEVTLMGAAPVDSCTVTAAGESCTATEAPIALPGGAGTLTIGTCS
ncbi:hypothetical protein QCA50_013214 [Cerrena zonata]|uniref:Antifreeze protein n=1 Tax=Cerrena zonata TaxID=2478898 RepID=A0AAW0G1P5_9APHY